MGYNNTVQNRSNERITEFFLYSNSYSNDQQRNKCKTYVERVRTWSISKVRMLSLPLKENNYNFGGTQMRCIYTKFKGLYFKIHYIFLCSNDPLRKKDDWTQPAQACIFDKNTTHSR
jgi:hypothetical protein